MTVRSEKPSTGIPNTVLGVVRLARGNPWGFDLFGYTPAAFLRSLAPLVAFPLVGAALMIIEGSAGSALSNLLVTVVALLTPSVVSHALARRWGRGEFWLQFAVAFNWCQWTIPLSAMVMLMVSAVLLKVGVDARTAAIIALGGIMGYGLWLHWFLIRHGLRVSSSRALAGMLLMNAATVILVTGPRLVAGLLAIDSAGLGGG